MQCNQKELESGTVIEFRNSSGKIIALHNNSVDMGASDLSQASGIHWQGVREIESEITRCKKQLEKLRKELDDRELEGHTAEVVQPEDANEMKELEELKELEEAILFKDENQITKAIERNPNIINAANEKGNTPLHVAVMGEDLDVIKLLLRNGASPYLKNKDGKKPVELLNYNELRFYLQDIIKYPYKLFDEEEIELERVSTNFEEGIQSKLQFLHANIKASKRELAGSRVGSYLPLSDDQESLNPPNWHEDLAEQVFKHMKVMKTVKWWDVRRWDSNEDVDSEFSNNLSEILRDSEVLRIFASKYSVEGGCERLVEILASNFKHMVIENFTSISLSKLNYFKSKSKLEKSLLLLLRGEEFREIHEDIIYLSVRKHANLYKNELKKITVSGHVQHYCEELKKEVIRDLRKSFPTGWEEMELPKAPRGEYDYYHPINPICIACMYGDWELAKALFRHHSEEIYFSWDQERGVKYPADLFIEAVEKEGKLCISENVEFLRYLYKLHAHISVENIRKLKAVVFGENKNLWDEIQQVDEAPQFTLEQVKGWSPSKLVEVDEFGSTKLHQVIAGQFATKEDKKAAVQYLLGRQEINIDALDRGNDTALTVAMRVREPEIANMLIDAGCILKQGLRFGSDSPFLLAIRNSAGEEIEDKKVYCEIREKIGRARDWKIGDMDFEGLGPVEYAILNGDTELALDLNRNHKIWPTFSGRYKKEELQKFIQNHVITKEWELFLGDPIKYHITKIDKDFILDIMINMMNYDPKDYCDREILKELQEFTKEKLGENHEIYYMIKYPMHYAVEHSNMELLNRLFHYGDGNPELRDEKCELDVAGAQGRTPMEMAREQEGQKIYIDYFAPLEDKTGCKDPRKISQAIIKARVQRLREEQEEREKKQKQWDVEQDEYIKGLLDGTIVLDLPTYSDELMEPLGNTGIDSQ